MDDKFIADAKVACADFREFIDSFESRVNGKEDAAIALTCVNEEISLGILGVKRGLMYALAMAMHQSPEFKQLIEGTLEIVNDTETEVAETNSKILS